MQFDPLQPAEEMVGIPGVAWSQNGRCFDGDGREVIWRRETLMDEGEAREVVVIERVAEAEEPEEDIPEIQFGGSRPHNAGEMHWTALKAKLAMFGVEYTTKEAALAFLAGKGEPAP